MTTDGSAKRQSLDEAWAAAESAAKEAGPQYRVFVRGLASGYEAGIEFPQFHQGMFIRSDHATPADALSALTARLSWPAESES